MKTDQDLGFEKPSAPICPGEAFFEPIVLGDAEQAHLDNFARLLDRIDDAERAFNESLSAGLSRLNKRRVGRYNVSDDIRIPLTDQATSQAIVRAARPSSERQPISRAFVKSSMQRELPMGVLRTHPNFEQIKNTSVDYCLARVECAEELATQALSDTAPKVSSAELEDEGPQERYKLLKQFVFAGEQPEDSREFLYGMAMTFSSDIYAHTKGNDSRLYQAVHELVEGVYNDFMFMDFLGFVADLDPNNVPREFIHTHNQIRLLCEFNDMPQPDLLVHMLFHKELLASMVRVESDQQKQFFVDKVVRNDTKIRKALADYRLDLTEIRLLSSNDIDVLEIARDVMARLSDLENTTDNGAVEAPPRKRVRVVRAGSAQILPEVELVREPYKLYFEDAEEPLDLDDETALNKALGKELKTLIMIPGFIPDLVSALKFLSTLNFQMHNRGINTYSGTFVIGGEKIEQPYAYKPADVPGLSLRTKAGKKLRMLFSLESGNIKIHKILERDDMYRFETSHGAGRARTRGQK